MFLYIILNSNDKKYWHILISYQSSLIFGFIDIIESFVTYRPWDSCQIRKYELMVVLIGNKSDLFTQNK